MELTLSVLARVRTLFAAGASVEDVYEALVAPRAAADLRESDALHARRAVGGVASVDGLAQDVARLATLVEHLRQDQGGAVVPLREVEPSAPPVAAASPAPQTSAAEAPAVPRPPMPAPQEPSVTAPQEPEQQAPAPAPTPRPAEPPPVAAAAPETRPQKPQSATSAADGGSVSALDLRDQIAVAVMRISMLMGDDDRRPTAARPDPSRRAG